MANIFLTRKCNLKCPYCFADEFVNKENEEITLDNFKTALNFIKTDKNERVGLIGGEPTLHHEFSKILEIIIEDEDIKESIIFSNGIEIDKYVDYLKNEKFKLLVNCNSSKDIGEQRYEKLKKNILLLNDVMSERLALGINIYSPDMDYSYIFDLLKLIDNHFIRFSTALPNEFKEETTDILESFKEMKNVLFSFFKDCYDNEVCPSNDCNSFPDCFYTPEDKLLLVKLAKLSAQYKTDRNPIYTCHICSPVIDILPDMQAVRCFGLSKYTKMPINQFKTIQNLRKYFYNKMDIYAKTAFINEDCENCTMRLLDKCGICFTYKLKKIQKNRELLTHI